MNVTVLGNNSTTVQPGGACSSYLITHKGKKLLVDLGNGSLFNLKKVCALEEVDGIILTHHHFDHLSDLFLFRYEREGQKYMGHAVAPIPLYSPKMDPWLEEKLMKNNLFHWVEVKGAVRKEIFDLQVDFVPVEHLIETYALRITQGEKTFVYSADTGLCEGIKEAAKGADLFLCEATYLSTEPYYMKHHLQGKEAGIIAKEAGVKKLLLTHLPETGTKALLAEAQAFHEDTALAEILTTYEL